jgi:hypothetical protein
MSALGDALRQALQKKNPAGQGGAFDGRQPMLEQQEILVREPAVNTDAGPPLKDAARRAKGWLRARLDRMAREGDFAELDVLVWRELAEELLGMGGKNRRLKVNSLPELFAAAREGRWINTGHPIVISSDATLQDGQHRLTMIKETGIAVPMDIRFGVDPKAFAVTDTGSKRTGGDTLQIAGFQQENALAATARILCAIDRGLTMLKDFPNDVLLKYVNERPALTDAVRIGHSSSAPLKTQPSPMSAAAYLIILGHGVAVAEEFFTELRKGAGPNFDKPNNPLPRLRKMIVEGEYRSRQGLVAGVVLAFNLHRSGRAARGNSKLTLAAGEPFPKVI